MGLEKDWRGRPVPPGEGPDTKITVWEVSPHPGTSDYDAFWEREWQSMLSYTASTLEYWLETFTEEELREGVTLTFKLVDIHLEDYPCES